MSNIKLAISAIIITYNEKRNIEECLKSIDGLVDEIFVVDSFSTDITVELSKKYTDRIYQHVFENFARQRNWAQHNLPIKNEWVLHLDADERLSAELAADLRKKFASSPSVDGFMIARKTIFRGRWIRHGGHYPVYHLRIFKKDKGKCEEKLYDQHYIVKGEISKLRGDLLNIIDPDLERWMARHKRWAHLEAKEILINRCKEINMSLIGNAIERRNWIKYKVYYCMPLFIRPFLYFFYRYILRFGFLDGSQGLKFHLMQGFWYRWIVDLNIKQIKKCIY